MLHRVHMLFNGGFTDITWKEGETRFSRFVFIGKNLDEKELTAGFLACKASDNLRFKVGEKVEANIGGRKKGGFSAGKVIKLWDEGNPYRVRLTNGEEVWASVDVDELIRAGK